MENRSFADTLAEQGIRYEFVTVARYVRGILYQPLQLNEKSRIGILLMHSNVDYLTSEVCAMARYGYRILCANVSDERLILDRRILEAKAAVQFLREYPGVEKVVLWGHSGGATLLSAYQRIAENGAASCQGPEKIHKCPDQLDHMAPADGIMLIDANWGNAAMMLLSADPALTSEDGSTPIDQTLNLFNPENGFHKEGSSFSREFTARFQKAQGERCNRLIAAAQDRLHRIESGDAFFQDDEPFVVIGAAQTFFNNKLFAQDPSLFAHTQNAWPLIHGDGSITREIVHSVRKPANHFSLLRSWQDGALTTTVRNFLAEYAIRTTPEYSYNEDSLQGVDWASTYSSPVGNVEDVHVPTLIMGMTAGWEYIAAESIYEHSGSTDKHLAFVEGANHLYKTATECEAYPGQFGDTLQTILHYVDGWLSESGRF